VQFILMILVRLYRWILSPAKTALFGPLGQCRFSPTCSAYALEALQKHGAAAGLWLSARRVCRCHPWAECGFDPVPEAAASTTHQKVPPSGLFRSPFPSPQPASGRQG
jgi:uncharacterized protein